MITAEDYKNPYGIWIVTTEGDCEGRSTRHLGVSERILHCNRQG